MTAEIIDLAKHLARPVMQRKLRPSHAYAAITNAIVKAERAGTLQGTADLGERINFWTGILGQFMRREDSRRIAVRGDILRVLRPLIAGRQPSSRLLAEAHNVNGAAGFPFAEREVTEIVSREVFWAMRRGGHKVG